MPFINKIANSELAFNSIGHIFCNYMETLLAIDNFEENKEIRVFYDEPHYKLYKFWKFKLKEDDLKQEEKILNLNKKEIEEKLNKVQKEIDNKKQEIYKERERLGMLNKIKKP